LLLVTIAVSVLVLLVLARLRFPEPPPPAAVDTSAQPLQRLAARAPYDELAAAIGRAERMIADNLIVLRVVPAAPAAPVSIAALLGASEAAATRYVPAARIGDGIAVAALAADATIDGIVGDDAEAGTAALLGADPVRGVARLRVPHAGARPLASRPLGALAVPTYVVAVEGTHAGVTMRPVFLGRGDRFGSTRWNSPLLPLGGNAVARGALVFTMDGEFLGIVVAEDGELAIAPAAEAIEAAAALESGRIAAADAGFTAQGLSAALADATGVPSGVIVADVDTEGPAADLLQPGDVVTRIDGNEVSRPERLLLAIASKTPGDAIALSIVRDRMPADVMITLRPLPAPAPRDGEQGPMRLAFRPDDGGTVVLSDDGRLTRSGIQAGDVITRIGDRSRPRPADVRRVLAEASGATVVAAIRRDGQQRIVAVATGEPADAIR
jgi:hypothetical protein